MSDAMRVDKSIYEKQRYTYADYLEWEGPERYQLFNGEAFQMASPSVTHQGLLMELSTQFHTFLRGKPCQVFAAPLDVRLFPKEDNSDDTVLQPDLLVVCDKGKLGRAVNGAPDLAVEILSPSNTHIELFHKFQYYLEAGVREYWIIEPETRKVVVHIYDNGHYLSTAYKDNERIAVSILPGLEIPLEELWARVGSL